MDELLAWVAFPVVALAICAGIGALSARVVRAELDAALLPAVGFAAAIAVLGPLFATGVGALPALALLVALALAGFLANPPARTRPGFGALTGAATYALHIAPVALTGSATFLGYNLLNDTAIHLALVDWIGDHGSRYVHQSASSYGATINDYVGARYPLGSHELLAALKPIVGLDPALVYQPFLAVSAGIAAAAIFALLRPALGARVAALAGIAALASQLVFSFALQGSIKELAFIVCLAAAAGLGSRTRSAPLLALPAAALFGIYGVYALPWIVPLALAAVALARPSWRVVAAGTAAFALAVAALVPDAIHYYNHGHDTITSGSELGPLAGPLKAIQVAGIWFGGDYRFVPVHSWITYAFSLALLVAALAGLARALRGRDAGVLLLVLPAVLAWAVTAPASSPYIDAKLLAILSPFVVCAAALGLAAIPRVRAATALAVVLGAGLLVSDGLAYRMALPAPLGRLDELARIDKRFSGKGPVLVNEYEEYVKHFMRRSPGSEPYETWTAARAQLRDPQLPVTARQYDLDQMKTSFVERWPLIVLRHNPAQSRPPSNYERVMQTAHYEVWQRRRPAPRAHVPLGSPPFDPTGRLDCRLARRLAGSGTVVAALRPRPLVVPIPQAPLPAGWYRYGPDGQMLEIHKGGSLRLTATGRAGMSLWLRGRTTRRARLGGLPVERSLQRITEWIRVGTTRSSDPLTLARPKRSLRPGDAQPDIVGPAVAVDARAPVLVRGTDLRKACGAPADWIDVLAPQRSSNQSG